MEKEEQASLMHDLRRGKGERHAHKTSETLVQRVIRPISVIVTKGYYVPYSCD
jgi:hypothetical protein